ncbi:hypothetical protein AAFC00_001849 [Neodothiora populina]|uniref:NAD(P)-binding protein n=1 Tax=Neodothiora populina TaxID=2781224 RepID=A0ABR3PQE2_9PEZI
MNYLITGAGRGIGRGLTRSLLSSGHRVFLVDNNADELKHTLALAPQWTRGETATQTSSTTPRTFKGSIVDLADRAAIKKMVSEVHEFFDGKLDVLVNNAFPTPHTWADDKRMEDGVDADNEEDESSIMAQWDRKIAVGLTAPFLLSRLCVPMLVKAGDSSSTQGNTKGRGPGCIVNISSTRWKQAEDDHEGYSAAKAGLQGLTQSLSVSLGHRYGIRVNAISPGWVHVGEQNMEADKKKTKWEDELAEGDHKWHPAGRVGGFEDIARTVVFLAESGFVTGQDVVVDGGVGRKMVYPEE